MTTFRVCAPDPENTESLVWAVASAPRTNNGITINLGQNTIEITTDHPLHGARICTVLEQSFNQAKKEFLQAVKEEYDDPALDPENDYCSCGNMTDNYPVICDHCKWMARMD